MRLVTFAQPDGLERVGVVVESNSLVDVTDLTPTLLDLIRGGPAIQAKVGHEVQHAKRVARLEEVRLLPPIPRPARNVFCVGMNYAAHVAEGAAAAGTSGEIPSCPVWFTKAPTSVCGPYDDIPLDSALTDSLDWEVELAVVIGKGGRSIDRSAAMDHVHSYTVFNDVSARDIQLRHGGQFFKGKSLDRTSPMGPWLVTADEVPDPTGLHLSCKVNGTEMQRGSTAEMIFNVADLIADISEVLALEPGDIIATGTPPGVGFARNPPVYLRVGDRMQTEIEGLGLLDNAIVDAASATGKRNHRA